MGNHPIMSTGLFYCRPQGVHTGGWVAEKSYEKGNQLPPKEATNENIFNLKKSPNRADNAGF